MACDCIPYPWPVTLFFVCFRTTFQLLSSPSLSCSLLVVTQEDPGSYSRLYSLPLPTAVLALHFCRDEGSAPSSLAMRLLCACPNTWLIPLTSCSVFYPPHRRPSKDLPRTSCAAKSTSATFHLPSPKICQRSIKHLFLTTLSGRKQLWPALLVPFSVHIIIRVGFIFSARAVLYNHIYIQPTLLPGYIVMRSKYG